MRTHKRPVCSSEELRAVQSSLRKKDNRIDTIQVPIVRTKMVRFIRTCRFVRRIGLLSDLTFLISSWLKYQGDLLKSRVFETQWFPASFELGRQRLEIPTARFTLPYI